MTPRFTRPPGRAPLAAALALFAALGAVRAQPLPDAAAVQALIAQDPVWRAAVSERAAEAHAAQALRDGNAEWSASLSAARREARGMPGATTTEWELGLERPWRRAAQADTASTLADRRDEGALARMALVRRERERALLEDWSAWLQAREGARLARAQVELHAQELTAVARRHALGDAARIERQLADAALAQARARAAAAQGTRDALRAELGARWPGLPLPEEPPLPAPPQPSPPPPGPAPEGAPSLTAGPGSPERSLAAAEAAAWAAQARLDSVERRPSPTWGVRLGQAGNGAERVLGVSLTLPFGGPARDATARASQARAGAAALALDARQREDRAAAMRREAELRSAWQAWHAEAEAAQRLEQVADALARGLTLGEGSLADLLAARRLAQAQRLGERDAAVAAWRARWRAELEHGDLWAPAPPAASRPSPTPESPTP